MSRFSELCDICVFPQGGNPNKLQQSSVGMRHSTVSEVLLPWNLIAYRIHAYSNLVAHRHNTIIINTVIRTLWLTLGPYTVHCHIRYLSIYGTLPCMVHCHIRYIAKYGTLPCTVHCHIRYIAMYGTLPNTAHCHICHWGHQWYMHGLPRIYAEYVWTNARWGEVRWGDMRWGD